MLKISMLTYGAKTKDSSNGSLQQYMSEWMCHRDSYEKYTAIHITKEKICFV